MTAKTLSVIVLTCNRLESLKKTFRGFELQNPKPSEVIVVDTGSKDGTIEWVKEYLTSTQFPIKLIEQTHGSFAEARNLGVEHSTGDYVAFIDDDCEPHHDWTEKVYSNLEEYSAVGGIAIPGDFLVFPPLVAQ